MTLLRRTGVITLALLTAGGLAACGDDEAAASDEACTAYIEITQAFNEDEPDAEAISGNLDILEEEAPEDVEDDVQVMIGAAREALETQDFAAFETDEFTEAQGNVDPFMFEECDADEKVEVTAVDYAFEGVPDSIDAGEVAFLLENEGEELHEMLLLRKKDDTTESFDEILELPEEEGQELVEFAGAGFAFPGATTASWTDLEAGEYTMVCFIPVGTTPEAGDEGGDGPPHFVEGMRHDFVVE